MNPPPSLTSLRLLLLLAIVLGFFVNLQSVPLFDLDEGAFSEATREMLLRGDFISPYLNGVPRFDKPAFIHWLQAASVTLLGWNEFALRLPSALAATAWVLVVYGFARTVRDERTGLIAAIAMATSLEIPLIAKAATADAVLNLFITAALLTAFLYYQRGQRRYLYLCFALMGFGFLTKGPVAVAVPGAVTLLFYASKGEWRAWLRAVTNPAGLVLFAALTVPWYMAQYLKQGDAFIAGFFFKHNLSRFQDAMEGHSGSVFYYLPVVLIGVLPYTAVLLKTLAQGKTLWRDELRRYLLIWFLLVLVLFSLSSTKLPHYVVYGYAALYLLMALNFDQLPARIWLFLPPLLLFVAALLLPELIDLALPRIKDDYVVAMLRDHADYFGAGYRLFFAAAIVLMLYFLAAARHNAVTQLLVSGLVTVFAVSVMITPVVAALQQAPIKEAAAIAKARDYRVVMWRLNTPSFSVYAERLVEKRDPRPGDVVLTKTNLLPQLAGAEVIYEKNGIVLARLRS